MVIVNRLWQDTIVVENKSLIWYHNHNKFKPRACLNYSVGHLKHIVINLASNMLRSAEKWAEEEEGQDLKWPKIIRQQTSKDVCNEITDWENWKEEKQVESNPESNKFTGMCYLKGYMSRIKSQDNKIQSLWARQALN